MQITHPVVMAKKDYQRKTKVKATFDIFGLARFLIEKNVGFFFAHSSTNEKFPNTILMHKIQIK